MALQPEGNRLRNKQAFKYPLLVVDQSTVFVVLISLRTTMRFVLLKLAYFIPTVISYLFDFQVTLMLLDQSNREHIIDAFRPDVTSSSFQRPVSEMNIASGCPLFCPLSKLDGKNTYIRDDTIFIKAIVDLTGL